MQENSATSLDSLHVSNNMNTVYRRLKKFVQLGRRFIETGDVPSGVR